MADDDENKPLNIKQERFAQNIAAGMPQYRAYLEAGYTQCDQKGAATRGHQLAKQANIKKRIAEIVAEKQLLARGLTEARHQAIATAFNPENVTISWIIMEFYQNLLDARDNNKYSDANRALEMIAKLRGLLKEYDKPGRPPTNATPMTPEEREYASKPSPTLNLQIINSIADKALRDAGDGGLPQTSITGETGGVSSTTMLDYRPGTTTIDLDRLSLSLADGLHEPSQGDGT